MRPRSFRTGNDDKETVIFMRGAMYERMKNYTEAEEEFRKALAINPDNASALNYLGYMLADRGIRLEEARDLIAKAVERDPKNGAYLDSLGWVLFRLNKLPEAEAKLHEALELMSRDPTVHDHLGDVYFHEGKIREAIASMAELAQGMAIERAERSGSQRSSQGSEEAGRRQGSISPRERFGKTAAVGSLGYCAGTSGIACFRLYWSSRLARMPKNSIPTWMTWVRTTLSWPGAPRTASIPSDAPLRRAEKLRSTSPAGLWLPRRIPLRLPASTPIANMLTPSRLGQQTIGQGEVRTWAANTQKLVFFVIGDFGTGQAPQYKIARVMWDEFQRRAKTGNPVRFILSMGDNIYGSIAGFMFGFLHTGAEDSDWADKFFEPYQPLLARVPFFPTLGNHDGNETEKRADLAAILDNFPLSPRQARSLLQVQLRRPGGVLRARQHQQHRNWSRRVRPIWKTAPSSTGCKLNLRSRIRCG